MDRLQCDLSNEETRYSTGIVRDETFSLSRFEGRDGRAGVIFPPKCAAVNLFVSRIKGAHELKWTTILIPKCRPARFRDKVSAKSDDAAAAGSRWSSRADPTMSFV
eukprot:scaffold8332_cov172-Amphora_coffeaeformis.AAC.6